MIYTPPTMDGKELWVPVVAKNRDWLIGYIKGVHFTQDMLASIFEELEIDVDIDMSGLGMDSTRFNDILPNDRRMSKLSKKEVEKFFNDLNTHLENKAEISDNPDDVDVELEDKFLVIECPCDMGFYNFLTEADIPHDNFNCQICGRPLIQYTNVDDTDFDYDGEADED